MNFRHVQSALLAICVVGFWVSAAEGQKVVAPGARTIDAVRVEAPPATDGILEDACWRKAEPVTDFFLLGANEPAKYQSFGYVCYDDANLYVGMKCLMPKGRRPVGKVRPHDSNVFQDECVEIMLDPGRTRSNHYQIAVNAYGSVFDCMRLHEARIEEKSWNSDVKTATRHGDGYWSVEVAIPFRNLAISPEAGSAWGINLCREAKNPNELSSIAIQSGFNQVKNFAVLKEVKLDYRKVKSAPATRMKVTNVPWQNKIFVTLNMTRLPKLPADANVRLSLRRAGREVAGFPRRIGNLDRRKERVVKVSMKGLPVGEYELKAVLVSAAGKPVAQPVTVKVPWPETTSFPRGPQGAKQLNNLVTELLNVSDLTARKGGVKYEFTNPRRAWVFVSCAADLPKGGSVAVSLDSDPGLKDIIVVKPGTGSPVEAMRILDPGRHQLVVRCGPGRQEIKHLIVRAIPELGYATYPLTTRAPQLDPGGVPFLKEHVLSSVNCIASRGDMSEPGHRRFVEAWKEQGKRWLTEFSVREVPDADTAYQRLVANQGFREPIFDGAIGNEFCGSTVPYFPFYATAISRLFKEQEGRAKTFCAYVTGLGGSDAVNGLVATVIENGCIIAWECYLKELSNEEAAWRYVEQRLARPARKSEAVCPGTVRHLMIAMGYLSAPPESQDTNASVDFKVYLDMQFNFLANHPVFDGLYGIQMYQNNYAEEETQRWAAKLMRHYCIEGKTAMLSTDPYEMDYITNPDFNDGTHGWALSPAEKGSITTCHKPGLGWLQARYPRTSEGDNALLMARSAKGPNSVSQTITNLKPGRLYTLRMYTCDAKDTSKEQDHAVSIEIDNAVVIPDRSLSIPYQACHEKGWLGYHWRLFRAMGTSATLTISDWAEEIDPGGPTGQGLLYNFIQIQPYFEDPDRPVAMPPLIPTERVTDWWKLPGKKCVAAYQAVAAEGLEASLTNLANPGTNDLKPVGAPPAWSARTGWTFGGSAATYFKTGILPRPGYSIAVHVAGAVSGVPVGADGPSDHDMFVEVVPGATWWRYGGGKSRCSRPGFRNGVLALAGPVAYRDGRMAIEGVGGKWPAEPGKTAFIVGARNKTGKPLNPFSGHILAVAIYSDTLTAREVAALTRRMRAMAAAPAREGK